MTQQYITPPPDLPMFVHKHYPEKTLPQLIVWAQREFQDRLIHCAERGYFRTLKYLNEEYSPIRILAEMSGFRKICSYLINNEKGWNKMTVRERRFIRSAYELRDLLLR